MIGSGPLFDKRPPTTLPPATLSALMEIPSEGKRAWIESLLVSTLTGSRTLAAVHEALCHERIPHDLVARLTDPMREEHP